MCTVWFNFRHGIFSFYLFVNSIIFPTFHVHWCFTDFILFSPMFYQFYAYKMPYSTIVHKHLWKNTNINRFMLIDTKNVLKLQGANKFAPKLARRYSFFVRKLIPCSSRITCQFHFNMLISFFDPFFH